MARAEAAKRDPAGLRVVERPVGLERRAARLGLQRRLRVAAVLAVQQELELGDEAVVGVDAQRLLLRARALVDERRACRRLVAFRERHGLVVAAAGGDRG